MRNQIAVTATSFSKNHSLRKHLLEQLGSTCDIKFCSIDENWNFDSFIRFCKNANFILLGKEKINSEVLSELKELRAISKYGVGLDNIDFKALDDFGIQLFHTPGVNAIHVAEHTLGLILSLTRKIGINSRRLSQGVWTKDGGISLINKKIGIIGLGNVGIKITEVLKPFSCQVSYFDIIRKPEIEEKLGVTFKPLDSLFKDSDVISLHTPLDENTRNMVGNRQLNLMKTDSILINTSRVCFH